MAALHNLTTVRPAVALFWLPLLLVGAVALGGGVEPWLRMWLLAISVFAGLKWLSLSGLHSTAPLARIAAYLFLWPGMDAASFLESGADFRRPSLREVLFAISKSLFGGLLFVFGVLYVDQAPFLCGWVGGAGLLFFLHFGLFHLLSLAWRQRGINAVPIMNAPILSRSLGDFWGRRWNLAFRDLAHRFVFLPLLGSCGTAGAALAVFLVSGIVHDLVISIPAGAGYGLPTLYFLIQGAGLLFERSPLGKQIGLGRGLRGRLFCILLTLAPAPLLFHRPFIEEVMVPMLTAAGDFLPGGVS